MDKYVVAIIHPFVREQEISVYINSECVKVINVTLDKMDKEIYRLCEQFDIDKVNFVGGQLYALKFKDEFITNKFGNKNIEVHIQ